MKDAESKPLSRIIFIPLLLLIFLRPFFSGLAYPLLESYYENCAIILAILLLLSEQRFRLNLKTNPYNLPISLLLTGYIISTICSIDIQNSFKETIRFISYASIFFIVSQVNESQKNTLIKTIVISAAIISVYSIYQYFWGYQHTIDFLKKTGNNFLLNSQYARDILLQKRAIGTFPSPNILAGYLIMMFFITVSSVRRTAQLSRSANGLRFIVLTTLAIALILTKSFGAYLSFVTALIALFFIFYRDIKKYRLIIIICSVFIILGITFIISNKWGRLMNLDNPHNPIMQRLNYWRISVAAIRDHPFLGIGPGNFQEVFLKYRVDLSNDTRYSHNIFLNVWLETGLIGLIAIGFLIITFIRTSLIKSKYLFLAGMAFILHNLIDITYFIPEAGLLWWVILGLAAASLQKKQGINI